jgi:hypothetical protein
VALSVVIFSWSGLQKLWHVLRVISAKLFITSMNINIVNVAKNRNYDGESTTIMTKTKSALWRRVGVQCHCLSRKVESGTNTTCDPLAIRLSPSALLQGLHTQGLQSAGSHSSSFTPHGPRTQGPL